eukprot:6910639-Alexandrium_andersonii.AAC.1
MPPNPPSTPLLAHRPRPANTTTIGAVLDVFKVAGGFAPGLASWQSATAADSELLGGDVWSVERAGSRDGFGA